MARLLPPLSEQVTKASDLNEFRKFVYDSRESLKVVDQAIKQSLETMLTNVQWMERNYQQLSLYIQHHL